jgi:hypothetical protein
MARCRSEPLLVNTRTSAVETAESRPRGETARLPEFNAAAMGGLVALVAG